LLVEKVESQNKQILPIYLNIFIIYIINLLINIF